MTGPRPSAAQSRRVFRSILQGKGVDEGDGDAAETILARFDGWRGQYWPSVAGLVFGVAYLVLVLGLGTDAKHPWVYVVIAVLTIVAALWLSFVTSRVRRFRSTRTRIVPMRRPACQIHLAGHTADFQKIGFAKLLHAEAGLRLVEAKRKCDDLFAGSAIEVSVPPERVEAFMLEAQRLGVVDVAIA